MKLLNFARGLFTAITVLRNSKRTCNNIDVKDTVARDERVKKDLIILFDRFLFDIRHDF
jgi:hypothetical protein